MEQQVTQALKQAFPGIEIEIEEMPGGRLSGSVFWSGFSQYDQVDRQNLVRDALEQALGAEAQQVGVLLTYTPVELSIMQEA